MPHLVPLRRIPGAAGAASLPKRKTERDYMTELTEKYEQALRAIDGWHGNCTHELETLVDAAEDIAYDLAWDDDCDELDETAYSSMCDEIRQAAGTTGNEYPDYPEWPNLIAAGQDGLLLVLAESDGPGERMSIGTEDNPEFGEEISVEVDGRDFYAEFADSDVVNGKTVHRYAVGEGYEYRSELSVPGDATAGQREALLIEHAKACIENEVDFEDEEAA